LQQSLHQDKDGFLVSFVQLAAFSFVQDPFFVVRMLSAPAAKAVIISPLDGSFKKDPPEGIRKAGKIVCTRRCADRDRTGRNIA
jgi:hypothetical protein